jgi:hypothetical protein
MRTSTPAGEVRRLTRAGPGAAIPKAGGRGGEAVDEAELTETLTALMKPGDPVPVPALPESTAESVARGNLLHRKRPGWLCLLPR